MRRLVLPLAGSAPAGPTYTLACDAGSFTLTGNAAALTASRLLSTSAGSFALTGNAAALTVRRLLTADVGSFALLGNDASITEISNQTYVPGHFYTGPRYRTDEERRKARLKQMGLDVPPEKVVKAAQKIAKRIAKSALTQDDPIAYLERTVALQQQAMQNELARQKLEYEQRFLILLQIAVDQIMQEDEIVRLLFEM